MSRLPCCKASLDPDADGCGGEDDDGDYIGISGANESTVMGPAIHAWSANDSAVKTKTVDPSCDGEVIVAYKVTKFASSPDKYQYEYAIYNHNSYRGVKEFRVPVSDTNYIDCLNSLDFESPEYHSGEPVPNESWDSSCEAGTPDFVKWTVADDGLCAADYTETCTSDDDCKCDATAGVETCFANDAVSCSTNADCEGCDTSAGTCKIDSTVECTVDADCENLEYLSVCHQNTIRWERVQFSV